MGLPNLGTATYTVPFPWKIEKSVLKIIYFIRQCSRTLQVRWTIFDASRKGFCRNLLVKRFRKSVNIGLSYGKKKKTPCFFNAWSWTILNFIVTAELECKISPIWRHFPLILPFTICWMSAIFLLPGRLTYWPRKYTTRVDPHVDNSHQVWSWYDHQLPSYSVLSADVTWPWPLTF